MYKRLIALVLALACLVGCGSAMAAKRDGLYFEQNDEGACLASWQYGNGDITITTSVKNHSNTDTVDAVDIAIYCMDYDGNIIYPDDTQDGYIRTFGSNLVVKRGETKELDECVMKGCNQTVTFAIAITRYHVKGGKVVNLAKENETDPLKKYDWQYWRVY